MEESASHKKLTRGAGTGNVTFGSDAERQQGEALARKMAEDTANALVTTQERFDRIEQALNAITQDPGCSSQLKEKIRMALAGGE